MHECVCARAFVPEPRAARREEEYKKRGSYVTAARHVTSERSRHVSTPAFPASLPPTSQVQLVTLPAAHVDTARATVSWSAAGVLRRVYRYGHLQASSSGQRERQLGGDRPPCGRWHLPWWRQTAVWSVAPSLVETDRRVVGGTFLGGDRPPCGRWHLPWWRQTAVWSVAPSLPAGPAIALLGCLCC